MKLAPSKLLDEAINGNHKFQFGVDGFKLGS